MNSRFSAAAMRSALESEESQLKRRIASGVLVLLWIQYCVRNRRRWLFPIHSEQVEGSTNFGAFRNIRQYCQSIRVGPQCSLNGRIFWFILMPGDARVGWRAFLPMMDTSKHRYCDISLVERARAEKHPRLVMCFGARFIETPLALHRVSYPCPLNRTSEVLATACPTLALALRFCGIVCVARLFGIERLDRAPPDSPVESSLLSQCLRLGSAVPKHWMNGTLRRFYHSSRLFPCRHVQQAQAKCCFVRAPHPGIFW